MIMEVLLGLLFWIALIAAISTHLSKGKRWWGSRGYRVRIVRRNCWIGLGVVFALLLAVYRPGNETVNRGAQPGPTDEEAGGGPNATGAAASVPATPSPEARASAEVGAAAGNDGYYCGTERWPVKTLSDEDSNRVNLKPVPSTVAELNALPRPPLLPDNRRAAPVELTTYVVRAILVETSSEKDNDIHVVIADLGDRSKTMITEVVDPGCQGAISSPELADFRRVRETLDLLLRSPTSDMLVPLKPGDLIEVTGVGFFDTVHGQTGVAPNAIEIHPVLGIRRVE
jgi:hypothetical protein